MLAVTPISETCVGGTCGTGQLAHPRLRPTQVRRLARGEALFSRGDQRTQLYRVERGALCHYLRWDDGRREIIEFAFPGDIIGFGHLGEHITTAQAVAKTIVSPVSEEAFEQLLETDAQLAARYAVAADREFDYVRARAVAAGRGKPVKRVASYLAALARISANEGRTRELISDGYSSGAVADQLDISLDALADALRDLEQRGIVAPDDDGLRIADLDALEQFADAA
ncbi:Crp/Fnr family transcriptional regulator [Hyphomicrobium sp. NDB2Meth4]|uniref:Crp/Fnr family transcriptional regulator n=1 Tax=Hyphomicrobium sp. NDB2Meth4 TaxID=1892846 RepID=UPI0009307BCC|nr:Crp/Fnr family transcriptional regulator [Hyphomicrobium sp. NDB2Meth4]